MIVSVGSYVLVIGISGISMLFRISVFGFRIFLQIFNENAYSCAVDHIYDQRGF